jgi:anti-sigma B factor antagonist
MTAVADIDHAVDHTGPALLDVRVHLDGGALLVTVAGEVDLLTAPEIARAVLGHLVARPRTVELDLSRVTYFGVTGIAALLAVRDATRTMGAQLRLVAGPAVTDSLSRLGLDRVVAR